MQVFSYLVVKKFALMIRYTSQNQIELFEFEHPFESELDKNNRWIKLSKLLPWDRLVGIYSQSLSSDTGRYGIDGRLAVSALIIKHRLRLSDREVIETIKENIYLQYFVGFKKFITKSAFDASLFVDLRKRMGLDKFDQMNVEIIKLSEEKKTKPKRKTGTKKGKNTEPVSKQTKAEQSIEKKNEEQQIDTEKEANPISEQKPNKGKLKVDATVADQMIVYPTDHGLLNVAREESEKMIDLLYALLPSLKVKPRTYRRIARKEFVFFSKKKNKTKRQIRKSVGKQLRYLRRNIKTIHRLLDMIKGDSFPLNKRHQKLLWVIQLLYEQQTYMYKEKIHSVKDRIVNIYQPYVRPIPRGKDRAQTEFGAKLGVSEVEGFTRINHFSWDAYNESTDLEQQVEDYYQIYGFYPEVFLADRIYITRANRKYLKEKSIRITGKPLGRPPSNESYYQKAKRRKEHNQRNHVEGKFGQGKNAYGLKQIRAKTKETSESWIANIFFVMNLVKLQQIFPIILMVLGMVFSLYFLFVKNMNRHIKDIFWQIEHFRNIFGKPKILEPKYLP
jgi:hypothetical protein